MTDPQSLLHEALDAWTYTRRGVIAEVENLPADGMDFRAEPETRSVAALVRHIVESGATMAGELPRPDGDFRRQDFDAFVREYAGDVAGTEGKEALLELLRTRGERGRERIRAAGAEQMMRPICQFDGSEATRLTWMHHGIAHEMYHRGQLALYARLLGRTPALTKQIRGEG